MTKGRGKLGAYLRDDRFESCIIPLGCALSARPRHAQAGTTPCAKDGLVSSGFGDDELTK